MHANRDAIIERGRGTHAGKVRALTEAGAIVVESFGDLPDRTVGVLAERLAISE